MGKVTSRLPVTLPKAMAAPVDTKVLVCRFDPRFREKQAKADKLLRKGVADDPSV